MGLPTWTPNTAYLAGAVVTETTGLPLWRCTVAGTSAAAEPSWPAGPPYPGAPVSDGGTLQWVINTTFRQDIHSAIVATLLAWKAANPTLLRAVWHARPASFTLGELPCAVLGDMTETITTMNGVRQRQMTGFTVMLVDRSPDSQEADDRMNLLVDALMDYLSANVHMASALTEVWPIGVNDGDSGLIGEASNLFWYSNVISFFAQIMEGRG
jgi:hypothetical protein